MNLRSRIPFRWTFHFLGFQAGMLFAQAGEPPDGRNFAPASEAETFIGDPACPGTGSCCVAHGGPGCNNTNCCNDVCNLDLLCCFAWSDNCTALADILCGSVCAGTCPGVGDCCAAHAGGGCEDANCCDLVCLDMPSCCESGWSAACAERAGQICDACEPDPQFDCPQAGDCCTERFFGGGCERAGCCATVCEVDLLCCIDVWDRICADEARDLCHNVCDCASFGDFDAEPGVSLRDAAAFLNCFSGEGSAPVAAPCACSDYDGDGDSDLADFAVFADGIAQ